MTKLKKFFAFIFLFISNLFFGQANLVLDWSSYYLGRDSGGSKVLIDNNGDLIICGGILSNTASPYNLLEPINYYGTFTTANAFQQYPNSNNNECYLAKFTQSGTIIWATYFGGPNRDGIRNINLDENNNIYISGGTRSQTGIATVNGYITDFNLISSVTSPKQIGFLSKFNSNGEIQWSTYTPDGYVCVKNSNEIYLAGITLDDNNVSSALGFDNNFFVYDSNNLATNNNAFLMKFDGNGNKVVGTYCGPNINIGGLAIDSFGDVVIVGTVYANNPISSYIYTSVNAYQTILNDDPNTNFNHGIISKFSSDLTTRIWSTFYGGTLPDTLNNIKIFENNIYVSGAFQSPNMQTIGNYLVNQKGLLSKFDFFGNRVWSTYIGSNTSTMESFSLTEIKNDKIFIKGSTDSSTFIATPNSFQQNFNNLNPNTVDGFILQYGTNGIRNWGTYFGGPNDDYCLDIAIINNNSFYLIGTTSSPTNIATPNSLQPNLDLGSGTTANNMFLAKFSPNALSTTSNQKNQLSLYPNPSNGNFSLQGNVNISENLNLVIYDNLGREIATNQVENLNNKINSNINLQKMLKQGVYFAKLESENQVIQTFKIFIK